MEAALKLAMRITGRSEVIALHGSYHGMSLGDDEPRRHPARCANGSRAGSAGRRSTRCRRPTRTGRRSTAMSPGARPCVRSRPRSTAAPTAAWRRSRWSSCRAPAGHVEFPRGYYGEVERVCRERGILLIVDEVQTALGRCGELWATDLYGVQPDMLTVGKAFGGGFPFGAVLDAARPGRRADRARPLAHPDVPEPAAAGRGGPGGARDRAGRAARPTGRASWGGECGPRTSKGLASRYEVIGDVRGPGLFIGVDLVTDRDTRAPATRGLRRGLRVGARARAADMVRSPTGRAMRSSTVSMITRACPPPAPPPQRPRAGVRSGRGPLPRSPGSLRSTPTICPSCSGWQRPAGAQ